MNDNNQNGQHNNNNRVRFNNPYHVDPAGESISIEKKYDRDFFCPLVSLSSEFGFENDYYSMRTVNPLKESFCHAMEALFFPNATFLQMSSFLCYFITLVYIILLIFGFDKEPDDDFLRIRLTVADYFSFHPKRIYDGGFLQYYRLLTFHFVHFNFFHIFFILFCLVSFVSLFECLIRKYQFLLILFLSGIFSNLTWMNYFEDNERYAGINGDIAGILGAFVALFFMNWKDLIPMFGPTGRFFTVYISSCYLFIYSIIFLVGGLGNPIVHLLSIGYGGLLFFILVKPIKVRKWKTILRYVSIPVIGFLVIYNMIKFYLRQANRKNNK